MPSFVYVLAARNPDGRTVTYVGWTRDLERRLAEHNGKAAGAKSTRGRAWTLVYAEKHRTRNGAMRREFKLKNDRAFRALLRDGSSIDPPGQGQRHDRDDRKRLDQVPHG